MKIRLILVAGGLSTASLAQAQAGSASSHATTAEQRLAEDLGVDRLRNALLVPVPDARNTASLLQAGTSNTTTVNQFSQGTLPNQATVAQAGTGNYLNILQIGFNNQTNFSQTGNTNQTTLQQNGSGNAVRGRVVGNDNALDVQQQGLNNSYSTQLLGNQGRYNIDQLGNNNSLTQREASTTTPLPGYDVKMEGSNMHITIEQGKAFP
jgi:hypothetical protein